LPCLTCREAESEQARAEIAAVYLAARSGKLPPRLPGPPLPAACCRRKCEREHIDAASLCG
jgi:hypothetical protein